MQSELPKVMHLLHGKPLVEHVVENVRASGVVQKPVVVVSAKHHLVQDHLGDRADYVVQHEQLGTGHAVAVTEQLLKDTVDNVIVLYGDMPYLKPDSIARLLEEHTKQDAVLTVLTATTPDFEDWKQAFKTFGRIVRQGDGSIARIVEYKDASQDELAIRELSTCFFCFRADWLWTHIKTLSTDNAQSEYYLTDLVQMAIDEGEHVASREIDIKEVVGINSREDLQIVEKL